MNLTLNTTKMKHRLLKQGLLALAFAVGSTAMAQNTTAGIAKQADIDYGVAALTVDGSVKLIDNKGTIKYIQASNGITTLTNTSATDVTTTTFQLGGTLTDDTYIDVAGNVFGLDGIALVDSNLESASTDAVDLEVAEGGAAVGTGYTILVRDEATGAVKKLKLEDLDVVGAQEPFTATAGQTNYALTGAPELTLFKTYVYRNGAKLIAGTDYTLSVTTGTITLATPANFPVFAGDIIEVHYLN